MSDQFKDYEFEDNDETFSGYMDDEEPAGGRHMREEEEIPSPSAPKRYERVTRYEEPEEEADDDYGDDFYTDSDGFEPEEKTMVFDRLDEENLYSNSNSRRRDRERERQEQEEKKKTGMIIAIIVLSAVILIGLIVFLTIALTSGGRKTDATSPSATVATQATQKPSEKPTEQATEKPTEKPAPTQAPQTQATQTEAPAPTEAPVVPTEAPAPTEAPDIPTEAPVESDISVDFVE